MRPSRPPSEIPPPLELECLKALWDLEEADVASVRLALLAARPLAYTTVMTILDRLAKRGSVERRKQGRKFIYRPAVSKDTMRRLALQTLVDGLFDGSEAALLAYLGHPGGARPMLQTAAAAAPAHLLDAALL